MCNIVIHLFITILCAFRIYSQDDMHTSYNPDSNTNDPNLALTPPLIKHTPGLA